MESAEKTKTMSPAMLKVWDDLVQKVESDPGVWSKPWFLDEIKKIGIRVI